MTNSESSDEKDFTVNGVVKCTPRTESMTVVGQIKFNSSDSVINKF
jgi:hypothetical protein